MLEVTAADAAWCRETVDTVLELLRPHKLWYAAVHRISPSAAIPAAIPAVVSIPLVSFWGFPLWGVLLFGLYLSFLVAFTFRERFFPAAEILVRRRGTQPAAPGGGSREPSERSGGEPAR